MKNIYLVGFMGTGKTCVGKEMSKKHKLCFVDLDELIELREKRIIADIFAKQGEAYFRRLETRILKEVAKEKGLIVSIRKNAKGQVFTRRSKWRLVPKVYDVYSEKAKS